MVLCNSCGHDQFVEHYRWDRIFGPLRTVLFVLSLLGVGARVFMRIPVEIPIALIAGYAVLALLARFAGAWYWGGLRCKKCGGISMYR